MSTPDPEKTARISADPHRVARWMPGDAQFSPGTIIAGRYRVASLLGSGGMGEVYRAEDTKLGQDVALKFLPARLAKDETLLMRLHDEVRLGRQIAHPNVCRIYDIGEWEGAHFVAMEYVDGEDLRRLLHRIGRLAHDKAVDIARGVAAGLHAAHAKGILHRDLKPANVMLDSHGHARITDFGLALGTDEADMGGIAGTPAYMAPEQLEGKPASVQSDLYALGLLMYELFTGKRPFRGSTLPELRREHSSTDVMTPSDIIRDLDPAVERIILRCLHPDPAQRPRSAREVIDALPGGDPLAAALAAGETPSPRVVAAAGSEGSLRPATAWTLLVLSLAFLGVMLWEKSTRSIAARVGMQTPPEVHVERAMTALQRLGVPQPEAYEARFRRNLRLIAWIETTNMSNDRWERLHEGPPAIVFWIQRTEPKRFIPSVPTPFRRVTSGVTDVELDLRGRLYSLQAIADPSWPAKPLQWQALLAAAGLDRAGLAAAEPRTVPSTPFDARAAWSGKHPDNGVPIRVDAAAWRGTPVFFRVSGPWEDDPNLFEKVAFGGSLLGVFIFTFFVAMFAVGALLAWRNLRLRRGDRQGAFRVAATVFLIRFAIELLYVDHLPLVGHELAILSEALANALFMAALMYLLYIAVEPVIRRRWPDHLIAWSRLLAGDRRNPMIGRDLLIGMSAGLFHGAAANTSYFLLDWLDDRPGFSIQDAGMIEILASFRYAVTRMLDTALDGAVSAFVMVTLMVVLTMIFRHRAAGVIGLFALWLSFFLVAMGGWFAVVFGSIVAGVNAYIGARYGVLTLAAMMFSFNATFQYPMAMGGAWAMAAAWLPVVVVTALALYAFRISLGSRSPFSPSLLDD